MIAKFLKPHLWGNYVDFANGMQDALAPFGDSTDHEAVTRALRSLGIESYFSYTGSANDMAKSLFLGVPVLAGTAYKSGGHMLNFIGRTPSTIIAHDPYGVRAGASNNWVSIGNNSGAFDTLSYNWLNLMVFDQGNEAGWLRFFTAVDGKPTGVPSGL